MNSLAAAALITLAFTLPAIADTAQTPPTFVVNTNADRNDGLCGVEDCTLREAAAAANANSATTFTGIRFAANVRGTINVTQPNGIELTRKDTSITGPGPDVLTLNGGGVARIFNVTGAPDVSIVGLRFENGQVTGVGGAINVFGVLLLEDCVFVNNKSTAGGGAIAIETGGSATIAKCVFTGNSGSGNFAFTSAGAILDRGGLSVRDSTFINNFVGLSGGAIISTTSLSVNRCTFSGNSALLGGAIAISASERSLSPNVLNSTFSGNDSPGGGSRGGAIYHSSSNGFASALDVTNCTFSGNAAENGGAIDTRKNGTGAARVTLEQSIFKTGARGANLSADGGTFISNGRNISNDAAGGGSGTSGGGFLFDFSDRRNTDPRLDPAGLRDNGGPTPTVALLADSPAINGAVPGKEPFTDQRLYNRAGDPDIGAFEFGGTIPVTLANISTRVRVQTDDNVLIGGFIVTGFGAKRLMTRAIGPSLPVSGALADPQLELFDGAGNLIASNNNWQDAPNRQEIIDSTIAPSNAAESAILRPVDPGAYTVVVRGVNDTTGIGLVEVYDLDRTAGSKLANISTRGYVETGDNVMIGGVIVVGSKTQKTLVRAIGPSLSQSGVAGALGDPTLRLFNSNGVEFGFNNNWRDTDRAEIEATSIPPPNDLEAAIVTGLPPGSYTAVVAGNGGTTGVALVEVYALP